MATYLLNQMTQEDLEDFACKVKDVICYAMVADDTLKEDIAEEWTRTHIVALRKPCLISRLFKKGDDERLILVAKINSGLPKEEA